MFIGYIQCCTEWQSCTSSSVGSLLIAGPPTRSITSDFTSRSGAGQLSDISPHWFPSLSADSCGRRAGVCWKSSQHQAWERTGLTVRGNFAPLVNRKVKATHEWTPKQKSRRAVSAPPAVLEGKRKISELLYRLDKGWKVFWRKISFWPPVETPAGPKTIHFSMLSFKEDLSCYFSLRCRIKGTKNSNCHQKAWEKWIYNANSICFLCLHIHHVIKRICRLFPERRQLC